MVQNIFGHYSMPTPTFKWNIPELTLRLITDGVQRNTDTARLVAPSELRVCNLCRNISLGRPTSTPRDLIRVIEVPGVRGGFIKKIEC